MAQSWLKTNLAPILSFVGLGALFVLGLIISALREREGPPDSPWTAVLFVLPVLSILVFLRLKSPAEEGRVRAWLLASAVAGSALYLFAWVLWLVPVRHGGLSMVSLIFAFLLVGGCVWFTAHMLISDGLASHYASSRPQVLCVFLGLLLCVTYLLSFAIAFHDTGNDHRALYANPMSLATGEHSVHGRSNSRSDWPKQIVFKENSAVYLPAEVAETRPGDDGEAKVVRNSEQVESIVCRAWNSRRGSLRIVLTGRANHKTPTTAAYISNFELAQARAYSVQQILAQRLQAADIPKCGAPTRVPTIEWLVVPVPSESAAHDGESDLSVSVAFEGSESSLLNLLDYVYFTTYTITTTGYGDIVPVSSYAKFLVSVANIIEVFFMVILFGALLSLQRGSSAENQQAEEADSHLPEEDRREAG